MAPCVRALRKEADEGASRRSVPKPRTPPTLAAPTRATSCRSPRPIGVLLLLAPTVIPTLLPQRGLFANRTPQTRSLGLARAAFFKALFEESARHRGYDYSGYRSMLMADHTTMYWPVGRADEVVFVYGSSGHFLLTGWRAEKGVPRRLFQVSLIRGKRPFPYGGTLAKDFGGVRATVPRRYAKALKSLLQARRSYATYLDSASMGVYFCGVVRPDASHWPGPEVDIEHTPQQDDMKVDRDGFAITDEELRLMALAKKG